MDVAVFHDKQPILRGGCRELVLEAFPAQRNSVSRLRGSTLVLP